jgi:hypothetical protein
MKSFLPAGLFFAATQALSHPGHGEPGLLHSHGEWIVLVLVVALVLWRVLRR